jgi:hypothetical protein
MRERDANGKTPNPNDRLPSGMWGSDVEELVAYLEMLSSRTQWDEWKLIDGVELRYGNHLYSIYPENLTSAAKVWEVLSHLTEKTWATDTCLGALVHALAELGLPSTYKKFAEIGDAP